MLEGTGNLDGNLSKINLFDKKTRYRCSQEVKKIMKETCIYLDIFSFRNLFRTFIVELNVSLQIMPCCNLKYETNFVNSQILFAGNIDGNLSKINLFDKNLTFFN